MTLLDRYVWNGALRAFLLVAAGLTSLFSLLEFVEQLTSVGEGRYRLIDALVYVALTTPARMLQVAPASILLGSLLALSALARHSELNALRAIGISEWRITGAVLKLTAFIVLLLFALAQFVIPPAQQYAQSRRTAALSVTAPLRGGVSFWAQRDRQYLNVQQFEYGTVPRDIDIYAFAPDGTMVNAIHADRAEIRDNGIWLLTDVTRKTVIADERFRTEYLHVLPWRSFLPQQQAQLLVLPPDSMPPIALWNYVRDLEQRHQATARYAQELWSRIALPFVMVAMVLIAMPFAFGPSRSQSMGQQIAIGAIIGMVFTLCQQIAGRLDLLFDLNPVITALAPPLLMITLALYLFRRWHR